MISSKTKMKIRLAVEDYINMFGEEYDELLKTVERQRQNLKNDMAEIKGNKAVIRPLFTISETLSQMIAKKLTDKEREEFKELPPSRWFAKEFAQFRVTKDI